MDKKFVLAPKCRPTQLTKNDDGGSGGRNVKNSNFNNSRNSVTNNSKVVFFKRRFSAKNLHTGIRGALSCGSTPDGCGTTSSSSKATSLGNLFKVDNNENTIKARSALTSPMSMSSSGFENGAKQQPSNSSASGNGVGAGAVSNSGSLSPTIAKLLTCIPLKKFSNASSSARHHHQHHQFRQALYNRVESGPEVAGEYGMRQFYLPEGFRIMQYSRAASQDQNRLHCTELNEEEIAKVCRSMPDRFRHCLRSLINIGIDRDELSSNSTVADILPPLTDGSTKKTTPALKKKRSFAQPIAKKLSFLRRRPTDTSLVASPQQPSSNNNSSKPNENEIKTWGLSFDSLLRNKHGVVLFRLFLQREFSDENIEFWLACEEYKKIKDVEKLKDYAKQIYSDFVALQAPKEVNLDSVTRGYTIDALTNPDRNTFDQAQHRIESLMAKDSYPRFLRSELYLDLLK